MPAFPAPRRIVPGIALAAMVAVAAACLAAVEREVLGAAWLEPLVLAILLGAAIRSTLGLGPALVPGVAFSAKTLLEVAIVLLGASMSLAQVADLGFPVAAGIAAIVVLALPLSFLIGRALGLPVKLAALVACGNSICGNSAIAAAAPVLDAGADDVAASVAFTAAVGILVVVFLPMLGMALGMGPERYGILAGMTVYAVPQVLAATVPFGLASVQTGTIVKLVRVLMLGPVVLTLGLLRGRGSDTRLGFGRLVPWFILGFVATMSLRSLGLLPDAGIAAAHVGANVFTLLSMAALGLMVDVRSVLRSGGRVLAAGLLSLLAIGVLGGCLALLVA
jgi:uncharacterized integral membrane protein (TIGR00698 family)